MSAMNVLEDALLNLIFKNTSTGAGCPIGDSGGLLASATAGVFYISLHTANPGSNEATGDQTTSEAGYTGYQRGHNTGSPVGIARSGSGWAVTSGVADNVAACNFPACTASSSTVTHFGVGSAGTGAGVLFLWGALTSSLAVSTGITPSFAIGALDVTLD